MMSQLCFLAINQIMKWIACNSAEPPYKVWLHAREKVGENLLLHDTTRHTGQWLLSWSWTKDMDRWTKKKNQKNIRNYSYVFVRNADKWQKPLKISPINVQEGLYLNVLQQFSIFFFLLALLCCLFPFISLLGSL